MHFLFVTALGHLRPALWLVNVGSYGATTAGRGDRPTGRRAGQRAAARHQWHVGDYRAEWI